ncbi:MAG: hypothetical protein AAB443_03985 [Patescibacteria group bacterium]
MLTPALIYAALFSLIVLFGLVFLYSYYLGKIVQRDSDVYKRAQNIIEDAHKKAKAILDTSSDKAKEIVSAIEHSKYEFDREYKTSLRDTVAKSILQLEEQTQYLSKSYENMYEEIRTQSMKQLKDTLAKLEQAGEESLSAFRSSLKDQQLTSQYYIEKRLNQEFESAHKEIVTYKEAQMREVEEKIDKIVLKLSSEILGRAISLEDHEKLVFEALNKIKEEGVFNS